MRSASPAPDPTRSARRARAVAAGRRQLRCSTARRCGSPTAASPTCSSSSPRCRRRTAGQFTAFIVERAFPGVSTGKEEHKMGLHGSSTTPLILQDARVPAGERARRDRQGPQGRVQRPELRPLQARRDVQRRRAARSSARRRRTPRQRKQFGQPIASFGAIKHKLGRDDRSASTRSRAMLYRTAGLIDAALRRRRTTAAPRCCRRSRSSPSKRRS